MLGDVLTTSRRQAGLTQGSLAAKALLSVPTIRNLERGLGNLSSFQRVLDALGLELKGRNLPPGQSVGQQVATLRKRRGLSQRKFAEMANTTHPTLVALEKLSKGRLDVLDRALTVLGAGVVLVPKGTSLSFYSSAANASVVHTWQTPKDLLEKLYLVFGSFDLDPCSPTREASKAPVKARVHYTQDDDGLSLSWHGVVFLNPPYGRELPHWVAKARKEVDEKRAKTAIALIPSRTDTHWWHNNIARVADVFFLRGRLRFGEGVQSAPFPSALCVWGADEATIEALKVSLPPCWHQPSEVREVE